MAFCGSLCGDLWLESVPETRSGGAILFSNANEICAGLDRLCVTMDSVLRRWFGNDLTILSIYLVTFIGVVLAGLFRTSLSAPDENAVPVKVDLAGFPLREWLRVSCAESSEDGNGFGNHDDKPEVLCR